MSKWIHANVVPWVSMKNLPFRIETVNPDLNKNAIKYRDNHKDRYAVEIILHFITVKY